MRALRSGLLFVPLCCACDGGSLFTAGRDVQVCEDNIPSACGAVARCVLDADHYLEGRLPGARRFILRANGESDVRFELLLDDRRSPGTTLRLTVSEPNCSDKAVYDSAGRDIFRDTGADGVLYIPIHVQMPGDHLVELSSDAYSAYKLRVQFQ